MIAPSGATLRIVVSIMLATTLVVVTASVALGAGAAPCRVRNVTQGTFGRSMVRMAADALSGDRLLLRGTCPGPVIIEADVAIEGRGVDPTLTGQRRTRVVRVRPGAAVTLRSLIIEDGEANGWGGGGIQNRGTLRVVRVVVQGNLSSGGGAGIWSSGTLTVVGSIIRRNYGWYEAGLSLRGTTTIVRTRVVDNGANEQGDGGGLGNDGTLTIRGSVIARNKVDSGSGGGIVNTGTLTLNDSVVRSNFVRESFSGPAWGSGGGIGNWGHVHLIGSTVTNNTSADEGGGIYNWNWQGGGIVTLDATSSVTGNVPDDCFGTPAC